MASAFSLLAQFGPVGFVSDAIVFAVVGILGPIAYILVRRLRRRRYFHLLNRRTFDLRQRWPQVLSGEIPAESWRFQPMDCEIVEAIVLDRLEVAPPDEAQQLTDFLRCSGLLDTRIWEARHRRGYRRQPALVSLGRMRAAEAIPALADALEDPDADIRVAALRGLGRTGLPEAAEEILKRMAHGALQGPAAPPQNALLNCCRACPNLLLGYIRRADDTVRPLLARVLGEIATPELDEELLLLASDPLPEVRASAARALGAAKPKAAFTALSSLATDEAWFVRLRAVVAMGELNDPRSVPVLIGTLCDPNRHVRLRSAAALARMDGRIEEIMPQVLQTGDRYALQAFVSELERSGRMMILVQDLLDPKRRTAAQAALAAVLRAGTYRMLLDALVHHSAWRVRVAVARLLAASGEQRLLSPLETLAAAMPAPRGRRIVRWVIDRLREHAARQEAAGPRPDRVPA
jgi:HEAT repeat protein